MNNVSLPHLSLNEQQQKFDGKYFKNFKNFLHSNYLVHVVHL